MTWGGDRPMEAALAYADRGWSVFPCHFPIEGGCSCRQTDCSSPAKHPRVAGGLKAATRDEEVIFRWWRRWPWANIGIRTGALSGLLVIDIDPPHGGDESFDRLVGKHGPLPAGAQVRTGSGGRHIYFRHPGGIVRNDAGRRLGAGIDVRGDGGYVIAPPSDHASGGRYKWTGLSVALPDAPEWLVGLLREPERTPTSAPPLRLGRPPTRSAWAQVALERETRQVRRAIEGTRNATLNRAAFALGQIVGGASLDRGEVEPALVDSALAAGLTEAEARATIESGLSAGQLQPRWPSSTTLRSHERPEPSTRERAQVDLPDPS